MQALQQSLNQLKVAEKKKAYHSFQDAVGSSVDNSYDKPMTYQVTSAQTHISFGGQRDIQPGTNCQIMINDNDSLHHIDRYMIIGEVTVTGGILENCLHLFYPVQIELGSYSWQTSQQQWANHQLFCLSSGKRIAKYTKALGLDLESKRHGTLNDDAGYNNDYLAAHKQKIINAQNNQVGIGRVPPLAYTQKFAIPLHLIASQLAELSDDQSIYTGAGQNLKINLMTARAQDILMQLAIPQATYVLNRIQLVRCYSRLDGPRNDLLLKNTVQLKAQKFNYYSTLISSTGPVINAVYMLSKNDKCKKLIWSFNPQFAGNNFVVPGVKTLDADNLMVYHPDIRDPLIPGLVYKSCWNYPQAMVNLPIKQVDIEVSGHLYSLTLNQLYFMDLLQTWEGEDSSVYQDHIDKTVRQVYCLDLSRFTDEWDIGSASSEITAVRVQIILNTDGVYTYPGQAVPWSMNPPAENICSMAPFVFNSYLITEQQIEFKNGVYQ